MTLPLASSCPLKTSVTRGAMGQKQEKFRPPTKKHSKCVDIHLFQWTFQCCCADAGLITQMWLLKKLFPLAGPNLYTEYHWVMISVEKV